MESIQGFFLHTILTLLINRIPCYKCKLCWYYGYSANNNGWLATHRSDTDSFHTLIKQFYRSAAKINSNFQVVVRIDIL